MTYIQPLTFLFLIVIGFGLFRLRHCKYFRLPALAVLSLLLLSWPPIDWLLSRPLEVWYPVQPFPPAPAQAIVVLGSYVDPPRHERPYPLADKNTLQRCNYAAWLYAHWRSVPVLACGGTVRKGAQPVSVTMRDMVQRAGVPISMILTEEHSRSTYENAVYGAGILRKRGITTIALVVEAYAMPRAAASFQRQGITVVPAPCSFRQLGSALDELLPTWKAMARNENTLHEVLGLASYKLRSRI